MSVAEPIVSKVATSPEPTERRARIADKLRGAIEGVILALVAASPWAFGAVDPLFQLLLAAAIALLLVLWSARIVIEGRLTWQRCPVAIGLAGLLVLGAVQVLPLSRSTLRTLSPATADVYAEFLPATPERLPDHVPRPTLEPEPGTTLSLYPTATRSQLVYLLAILLVFVVARNNLTTPGALRRLCVIALINGALLTLLGLLQFFSSARSTIYWTQTAPGSSFGPFINRNHFAFYINMCLGLGLGLLLATLTRRRGSRRAAVLDLLQDTRLLWIGLGLAFLAAGVLFSQSRGGFLALAVAGAVVVMLWRGRARGAVLPALLGIGVVAAGLLAWFGLGEVEGRLSTLLNEDALSNRLPVWSRAIELGRDFPVFGTGYGTFELAERTRRVDAAESRIVYEHAHNEYLEAWAEGGFLRLGLALLTLVFAFRLALAAIRRSGHSAETGLALGALFALVALAAHSIGEFGIHIPAIAVLAATLCAALFSSATVGDGTAYRLTGPLPFVAALAFVTLGVVLVGEGWRTYRCTDLRLQALRKNSEGMVPAERIDKLNAAARLCPENAYLQAEIGQAHLELYEEQKRDLDTGTALLDVGTAFWSAGAAVFPTGVPGALPGWLAREAIFHETTQTLERRELVPGLSHELMARDLCPLLPEPELRLTLYADSLARGDARATYLARAKRLAPFDADLWFLSGSLDFDAGRFDEAWTSWRRALELSDRQLPSILKRATERLTPTEVLDKVLPEHPGLVVVAGLQLFADDGDAAERRRFFERAVALFTAETPTLSAAEWHRKAQALDILGQAELAAKTYRAALDRQPREVAWRMEYALVLRGQGQLREAQTELQRVLSEQPRHTLAAQLLREITQETVEKRGP